MALKFKKMHGLGNDFVVIDGRGDSAPVPIATIRAMADRHRGIGYDQLAILTDPSNDTETGKNTGPAVADVHLTFYNADGSLSAACGNATRCIARWLMDERQTTTLTLSTDRGLLLARDAGGGLTAINMGHPQLLWHEIPLSRPSDTLTLPLDGAPTATGMGNPHCTFFVDDAASIDLATLGPRYEHDPLFPQRTNVQFATVTGPDHIRMRVWERGTGITLASGSSSCATAVAAARRGLTGRKVTITLDGGDIEVDWRDDGVWMTGPTAHVFEGVWHG